MVCRKDGFRLQHGAVRGKPSIQVDRVKKVVKAGNGFKNRYAEKC